MWTALNTLGLDELETGFLSTSAPLEPPIRADLFGADRFAEHGRSLAQAQVVAKSRSYRANFFPKLKGNVATLRDACAVLETHAGLDHHMAPAAGWLVEHGIVLVQQLLSVRKAMPTHYYSKLPRLAQEPLAGLPRVYGIAWAWVAHTDSGIDESLLKVFLAAYQSHSPLTIGELWAIPTTLRVVLLENLARLAERAASVQAARHAAHRWIDATVAIDRAAVLQQLVPMLRHRGLLHVFALQLQRREDEWSADGADAAHDLIRVCLPDSAAALQELQRQEAEDHQSVRNAVIALRGLSVIAWREIFFESSPMLARLHALPVFAAESNETQDRGLHAIERIADTYRVTEAQVCDAVVHRVSQSGGALAPNAAGLSSGAPRSVAPDVGLPRLGARAAPLHWLGADGLADLLDTLGEPRGRLGLRALRAWRRHRTPAYLGLVLLGTLALTAMLLHAPGVLAMSVWMTVVSAVLVAVVASELVIVLLHRLIAESLPPRLSARLALQSGIPPEQRTLVVVPTMLVDEASIAHAAQQLEQHHLSNPERHVQFALLSDWLDADTQRVASDQPLLDAAQRAIETLNQKHAPDSDAIRFLLLHRERVWSTSEGRWIGWERKRGKLEQLIAWLVEGGNGPFLALGAVSRPVGNVRSIVTLDGDTDMPPGRLRQLVATAAHPLNAPVVDAASRRVLSGYTIFQPRITVPLPAPGSVSAFYWLFSGQWGVDPYSAATSEIYEDVFEEGSFTGKGLIVVEAAYATLAHRLPEGQVLSHDLLEGSLARCATVSDVTLVENAPGHPDVAAARLHRWTRGDWQLLPFLSSPKRWPMAGINRWKLFDNLRRSLIAPFSLTLLVWTMFTPTLPTTWALGLVIAAFGAGPLIGALATLAPQRDDLALAPYLRHSWREMVRAIVGVVWHVAWLMAQATLNVDAIVRAIVRQTFTRRHLLEWTTAAQAQAAAHHELQALTVKHAATSTAALMVMVAAVAAHALGVPVALGWALSLGSIWMLTPLWVWLGSRKLSVGGNPWDKDDADDQYMRVLARDMWRYYERYVHADDHHLPPDNVQFAPRLAVAHRTSPTNIGLYLLSVAAVREMGFIGVDEMLTRLERTLDTVERMPKWEGHLFNWYDTQSLTVLEPSYVSTVDSGNLCGHLLVLASACTELAARKTWADTVALEPDNVDAVVQIDRADVSQVEPPTEPVAAEPAATAQDANDRAMLDARLHSLAKRARTLALAPNFKPLYDPRRHLFHIGLRGDTEQLDQSHYDLLASESRLASLVAIAKGDVPPKHWAALGRPVFALGGRIGLKSWSGSMFEYLMPTLVLNEPAGSLLHEATRTAVSAHRAEASSMDTPWGISESAIAVRDQTLAYQYGPQGAAALALRRTPAEERVIAPYASAMALVVAPRAAVANLQALERLGVRRELGFIEALDYSPQRLPADSEQAFVPIETFMAHHQAMSLLACAQAITRGAIHRWSDNEPHLRAVLSLLHERAPHSALPLTSPGPTPIAMGSQRARWHLANRPLTNAMSEAHVLGNGRYGVFIRANGAGYSQWEGAGLTRWRDDGLQDQHGLFGYVRRSPQSAWVSLAARPAPDGTARYRTEFHADRVVLHALWNDLEAATTVCVSAEDDCELRRVELHNTGRQTLAMTLAMAFEATLAPHRADESHPAFSNLFIQARWSPKEAAMHLTRMPRLPDEAPLHAVHFLVGNEPLPMGVRVSADRAQWMGRLRSPASPVFDLANALPTTDGATLPTGLDPASVISVPVNLAPGERRTLTFALACGHDIDALHALVDRYRQPSSAARALEVAETLARIRLRELKLDPEHWCAWLALNALLTSAVTRPLPQGGGMVDRRALYRFGISGERPLMVVWVSSLEGVAVARQVAHMLALWTAGGVPVDVMLVNAEPASYLSPVQHALTGVQELATRVDRQDLPVQRRARLQHLHAHELSSLESATLNSMARVVLKTDGRSLAQLVARLRTPHELDRARRDSVAAFPVRTSAPLRDAQAPVGFFDDDSSFRFDVSPSRVPKRPWINVLANPHFGCHVSDSGAGFSWAGNSRLQQITSWSNDALRDTASEMLLLHDVESGQVWPLGRTLSGDARRVTHGIGWTRLQERIDGMLLTLCWCVDVDQAVKQVQVHVQNLTRRARHLRLVSLTEWTLGASRLDRGSVLTQAHRWRADDRGIDASCFALLATQADVGVMPAGASAFSAWRRVRTRQGGSASNVEDWTCDRREFFDAEGRPVLPASLQKRAGAGLDACAALGCHLQVGAEQFEQATLLMGFAADVDACKRMAQQAWNVDPADRLKRQQAQWTSLLSTIEVRTPDKAFDALVNHWLPYQSIACRLWARAGFYQAGGAFGYRDQLQDAMGVSDRAPGFLRAQIVLHASRQFEAGDVQHWWHPPNGAGVRTKISDDLLWLPLAIDHHLTRHGDDGLLDETATFLMGDELQAHQEDAYNVPESTLERASVYEHAARAIERSLTSGAHGLPLMGTGDWNDGMNRVGHLGRGESVWLGWFFCHVVDRFAPWAERRGDQARAAVWRQARDRVAQALETSGWDGAWYRRAYFDDGSPLGSAANAECQIDLIAQAWAAITGVGDAQRARLAMHSVKARLWDGKLGLTRLLDPPLQSAQPSAGYIQAYPPGIRENGGQYNHGAVWAVMAFAKLGDAAAAWSAFKGLSPAHRTADPTFGKAYELEPYVAAGDVYSQPPYAGRGGWSWYTGSAAWLQRAALESICGLTLNRNIATVTPCLPSHWSHVDLTVRHRGRTFTFKVSRVAASDEALQVTTPGWRYVRYGEPVDLDGPDAPTTLVVVPRAEVLAEEPLSPKPRVVST